VFSRFTPVLLLNRYRKTQILTEGPFSFNTIMTLLRSRFGALKSWDSKGTATGQTGHIVIPGVFPTDTPAETRASTHESAGEHGEASVTR